MIVLPRTSPNYLVWLVSGIVLIVAPHALRLPLWISACFVLLVGWRVASMFRGWPLPTRRRPALMTLKILLALSVFAAIYIAFGATLGRDSGTALLIALMGLKLIEMGSKREYYLVCFLGYFLVVTNFFYTQSIPTALYLLVSVAVLTGSLVLLNDTNNTLSNKKVLALSATLLGQSVPIMLAAFVLFPRLDGPLWGLPKDAHAGLTGLDDEMSPGNISHLSQSDEVAFRARFHGAVPRPETLYWRGPVLWETDGRTWKRGDEIMREPAPVHTGDTSFEYTITLEPHGKRWLFVLEMPSKLPEQGRITGDFQLLAERPVNRRMRYTAASHTRYRLGDATPEQLARALRLPSVFHPRSIEMARGWRQELQAPERVVRQALQYFRTEPFFYTLFPPVLKRDSVDQFLFETRRGFCEHYAAAFTVLMRAAGVPARVVTGYQGGEFNSVGDYLSVRQRDAHAWAEVWLDDQGWVRIDPTAAVSPDRVEHGIDRVIPPSIGIIPLGLERNEQVMKLWRRLRNTIDAIDNRWNQWVLGYDQRRQFQFMDRLGMSDPSVRRLAIWFVVVVFLVVAATAAWMFWRRQRSDTDEFRQEYDRFCRKLARVGIRRYPYEGPMDFARRAAALRTDLRPLIMTITNTYAGMRYGAGRTDAALLRNMVRRFRPSKKPPSRAHSKITFHFGR